MPSMPGRMMSVRMTSKASPSILASASSAELAASTSYPSRPKTRLSDSRRVVSSSTMSRRFVIARAPRPQDYRGFLRTFSRLTQMLRRNFIVVVIGRRIVNTVPEPFVLLIVIVPPWSRTVP